ncbi:MAG: putative zinc-binding protein [Bacillota bacterium]
MVERVCIFPCGGIKKTEATVARIAAYIVNEDLLPRQTMLLCVPAFLRGVEEDLVMAEDYPTVVIDCHVENCGTNLLYLAGITPAARVFIPEIAAREGLAYGHRRRELEPPAKQLAEAVAREAARAALAMLENPAYVFAKQRIKTETCLAKNDLPTDPFAYVQLSPGLYRPRSMPDFFPEGSEA